MPVEIVKASPQANKVREKKNEGRSPSGKGYPFEDLEPGQSFTVPLAECNWQSVRTMMYRKNREFRDAEGNQDREFVFVKHDDSGLCEVSRIV